MNGSIFFFHRLIDLFGNIITLLDQDLPAAFSSRRFAESRPASRWRFEEISTLHRMDMSTGDC